MHKYTLRYLDPSTGCKHFDQLTTPDLDEALKIAHEVCGHTAFEILEGDRLICSVENLPLGGE